MEIYYDFGIQQYVKKMDITIPKERYLKVRKGKDCYVEVYKKNKEVYFFPYIEINEKTIAEGKEFAELNGLNNDDLICVYRPQRDFDAIWRKLNE